MNSVVGFGIISIEVLESSMENKYSLFHNDQNPNSSSGKTQHQNNSHTYMNFIS